MLGRTVPLELQQTLTFLNSSTVSILLFYLSNTYSNTQSTTGGDIIHSVPQVLDIPYRTEMDSHEKNGKEYWTVAAVDQKGCNIQDGDLITQ